VVADICETNIKKTKIEKVSAKTLEWDDIQDIESCGEVEVILAADCSVQPFYGDSFRLWDVRQRFNDLARGRGQKPPVIILSAERRPKDGVDIFLEAARQDGAEVKEWWRYEDDESGQRIFIYQIICE